MAAAHASLKKLNDAFEDLVWLINPKAGTLDRALIAST
jgi:hypothetical protein